MNLDDLTIGEAKKLAQMFPPDATCLRTKEHPMIGRSCIIRTYSAGVHFGIVKWASEMEVHLVNAYRLWKWEKGGLSLSAVNQNGLKGGRINYTGEIYLPNVIEFLPMTKNFEDSYGKFIEDKS